MVQKGEKYYTKQEICSRDADVVIPGHEERMNLIAGILERVPGYVVDAVFEHCLFLVPSSEDQGVFIPNRVTRNRHIIQFPDALLLWPRNEQINKVLKQIAHYILHHWSPVERDDIDFQKQEVEALELVKEWIKKWEVLKSRGEVH